MRAEPRAHVHDTVDVQQIRRTIIYTTNLIYNQNDVEIGTTPEFYTGAPVDPVERPVSGLQPH